MIRKCERCNSPMDLFACAPRLGGLPELRTYRCSCCGDVETDAGVIAPASILSRPGRLLKSLGL